MTNKGCLMVKLASSCKALSDSMWKQRYLKVLWKWSKRQLQLNNRNPTLAGVFFCADFLWTCIIVFKYKLVCLICVLTAILAFWQIWAPCVLSCLYVFNSQKKNKHEHLSLFCFVGWDSSKLIITTWNIPVFVNSDNREEEDGEEFLNENWERPFSFSKPSALLLLPSPRRKWERWLPAANTGGRG